MSKLYSYLQKNIRNVFWFWELNHVIGFTYSAILSAAKDEADQIEVIPYQITWFKGEKEIGRRELSSDVWSIDFLRCFNKILKRDKVVKRCLKVVHASQERVVYELLHDISEIER